MPERRRPRARTMLRVDPSNPYGELGASPLATTEEIKALVTRQRNELLSLRKRRADQRLNDEEEARVIRLQQIEKLIGSPKARAEHDRINPSAELLTVQHGPRGQQVEAAACLDLVTAWLVDELGPDVALPSPECSALAGAGALDPELLALLRRHGGDASDPAPAGDTPDDAYFSAAELAALSTNHKHESRQ